MRLDQWLWAVRVYKTRSIAANAINAGEVLVDGEGRKPAHEVRAGQIVTARMDRGAEAWLRTLRVVAAPPSRVGAKLVPQFAEELTTPEEFLKRRPQPNLLPPGSRTKGTGRPTKHDRRAVDELGL